MAVVLLRNWVLSGLLDPDGDGVLGCWGHFDGLETASASI